MGSLIKIWKTIELLPTHSLKSIRKLNQELDQRKKRRQGKIILAALAYCRKNGVRKGSGLSRFLI